MLLIVWWFVGFVCLGEIEFGVGYVIDFGLMLFELVGVLI